MKPSIVPSSNKLTVLIRDDSPLIFAQGSPSYRTIQLELTPEQMSQISLKWVGTSGGNDYYEDIDKIFIDQ